MNSQLPDLLNQLAIAREQNESVKEDLRQKVDAVLQSDSYREVAALQGAHLAKITELTAAINELSMAEYSRTLQKKVHPHVEIKIFKVVDINSAAQARAWCFDNLPAALKLDETAVKKYAKDFGAVAGVTVYEEPRVQIASKLDVPDNAG